MGSAIAIASPRVSARPGGRRVLGRALLVGTTAAAVGLGPAVGSDTAAMAIDPDLARLLRYMALLKGSFAVTAVCICFWRLARPATLWREAVYVAGPSLMAGGSLCLWHLQSAGLAAACLHLAMFALLAAGLTDEALFPVLRRRRA